MFRYILFITLFCYVYVNCIKVCDDFKCYVKPDKKHCHDNLDGERNVTEILSNWPGVTVEEHSTFTEDGYEILLIRAYSKKEKDPVVLGHSIFLSVFGWVNRGEKSLAHLLIEQGHDVWIINFRGSSYSRGHKTLKSDEEAYWEFTLNEVAVYDLHSALEYTVQKTSKKAIYVGYGAGTTVGYIYGSVKSNDIKNTLKGMISLGPLAYGDGIKSYVRFLLPLVEYLKPVLFQRFHGELPLEWGLPNCSSLLDMYLGEVAKVPLYGDDFSEIDPNDLPLIKTQNIPYSVGVNLLVHYSQIVSSKKFQQFDYGKDTNVKKYDQETPPLYSIPDIPVPVAVFVGENDWIATKENARRFYGELKPNVQCGFNMVACDKWNHNDFIEAKDVVELLYTPLYKVIQGMCQGMCMDQK